MTQQSILTERQQTVLASFAAQQDMVETFVLSGGTALAAFYLHHRTSDDLDFFSQISVDSLRVHRFAEEMRQQLGAASIEANRLYDRHLFLLHWDSGEELKLEFTQYPYQHLEEATLQKGVRIESMRDIAADKLAAMLDRFEPKDYYDLYVLLEKGMQLPVIRQDTEHKFHLRIDPVQLGSAFLRAQRLPILPHLLEPIEPPAIQSFFARLAHSLKDDVIGE